MLPAFAGDLSAQAVDLNRALAEGRAAYLSKDYAKAIESYSTVIKSSPDGSPQDAYYNLAFSYYNQLQYQDAANIFLAYLKKYPADVNAAEVHLYLGRSLLQLEGKADEADFFYFPSFAGKKLGNPVLGGGTILTITKDSKGARAFMEYLQHPQSHEIWMAEGGFLTPHKGVDLGKYKTAGLKKQGEILQNATTFRFDGSDLMPGAVGAGSFWKGMVNYSGGQSAQQVADEIQKSWDAIK